MHAPAIALHIPRRRKRKPLTSGLVRIYKTRWHDKSRRRIYRSHTLIYRDAHGRHREKRNTLAAAQARAEELNEAIVNGRLALEKVNHADWASLQRALELLRPFGKSVELLAADYAEAMQTLRSDAPRSTLPTLRELVQFWHDHHPAGAVAKNCPDILTEMLAARKQDGASQNSLDDYESRLGRFIKDFTGPILQVTGQDINRWLEGLGHKGKLVSRRTRNNYRGNLVDFYRFARRRGYVPKTWSVLDDVPRLKNETVRIQVFTPEEITRILAARVQIEERARRSKHRAKALIPYLAIGAFAGCRHEEMSSGSALAPVLDWRHIDFEKEEIWVPKEVARKIGHDRILPMQPNLVAWLKPYAKANGPICELANANNALTAAALEAGLKWKDNGLRRSFISYRLAVTDNIGKVAREAGTSPDRIRHNYQKTLPKREGLRWFDIWPTHAEVLQLPLFGRV